MTTFTLQGLAVERFYDSNANEDVTTAVRSIDMKLTVPSKNTTMQYTLGPGASFDEVDLSFKQRQLPVIEGKSLDQIFQSGNFVDASTSILLATWSGGRTTALVLNLERADDSDVDYIFVLDGTPLPPITTVQQWDAFDNSITAVGQAPAPYNPNADFLISGIDNVSVTEKDVFFGTKAKDNFIGGKGNDTFLSSQKNDSYDGGKGKDTADYSDDKMAVTVDLAGGTAIDGWGKTDSLSKIENIIGSAFGDDLTGNKSKNKIEAGNGDDTIDAKGGKDTILAGKGKDVVNAGNGSDKISGEGGGDTFVFAGAFGNDRILDFDVANAMEKIDLSAIASIKGMKDLKSNHLSNVGGTAVIDDGNGNTITLDGVVKADLSSSEFIF